MNVKASEACRTSKNIFEKYASNMKCLFSLPLVTGCCAFVQWWTGQHFEDV
jgi:hypothetical protein